MLQWNDTRSIRARNRQTIRQSADQRRQHAIDAVEERLYVALAAAVYEAVEHDRAIPPSYVRKQATAIVDVVISKLRGASHE